MAGIASRRLSGCFCECLNHAKPVRQPFIGALTPVIEVASDDQRRLMWHVFFDVLGKQDELATTLLLSQRKMDTQAMDADAVRQLDFAMQDAAALQPVEADVMIAFRDDGEAGQHRVAMVSVAVDRISSVSRVQYAAREEFVLWRCRPIGVAVGVLEMLPLNFLQE